MGIIPTDTFPAVVCDLENREAVERLYAAQDLKPTKLLSIIVRNFTDVSTYSLGFAVSNAPGQVAGFSLAKRLLPGPVRTVCCSLHHHNTAQYTLILTASKRMPKQCLDFSSRKTKPRKTVGIRMPDHHVCRAITAQLDRPLLCSSVHTEDDVVVEDSSVMLPDPQLLFDAYAGRGIDFMVSDGLASWTAGAFEMVYLTCMCTIIKTGSTIVDLTTAVPSVLRQGQGAVDVFDT